jgi:uncharacterized protein
VSYSIDANLLVYASHDGQPDQAAAIEFLNRCITGQELLVLAWPTLMAYLRITTHPRIFQKPLSPAQARENLEALLALPHVRTISEGATFWRSFLATTEGMVIRGKLVPDAHLAALLLDHGVRTLYTADTDFRRFPALRVINPLLPAQAET